MELLLKRQSTGDESTIGTLHKKVGGPILADEFRAFTLEDQPNTPKIKGETRIPAGRYQIKEREVLSPLTEKYRAKYSWFRWHLQLQDVPDFEYVYIHVGNTDDHTDGCILVGDGAMSNVEEDGKVLSSRVCFQRLYEDIIEAFDMGDEIWITVEDYA